jgi:predicted type IV restriction endonuclease
MSTPPKVLELVNLFQRNADVYHAPRYNEAMVRQEFINPFFKCLGWHADTNRRSEVRVIWNMTAHQWEIEP